LIFIAALYFTIYKVFIYPPFLELRLLGLQIIQGGVMTKVGFTYLLAYSIAEGLLLVISVQAVRTLRDFWPK
jgi:hypothetical protein